MRDAEPSTPDPFAEHHPGAYALLIRLDRPARLAIASLGRPELPSGLYLYAGSAWGTGGIGARLRRHARRGGRRHWHIDHLRAAGKLIAAQAFPGARECDVLACALSRAGSMVPLPGFGATDCRHCPAHLLAVDPAFGERWRGRDSEGRHWSST